MPNSDRPDATVPEHDAISPALLDAMVDATVVLDPEGVIVAVNRAWRQFCQDNGGDPEATGIGTNYLEVCRRAAEAGCADAAGVHAGLIAVLAGETVERTLDYACPSPKIVRWFMVRMTPVQQAGLGALVSHTNITRRKIVENDLAARPTLDPLTRLGDREQLAHWLETGGDGADAPAAVGVLHLHVDGLESVGNAFGEAARDEVLQTLARRLTAVVRPGDGIARLGEHDFAVAAPGATASGLVGMVARVSHAVTEALLVRGETVRLTARVGSHLATAGDTLADCLRQADEAARGLRRPRLPKARTATPAPSPTTAPTTAPTPTTAPAPTTAPSPAQTTPAPPPRTTPAPTAPEGSASPGAELPVPELHAALEQALAERTADLQRRTAELSTARKELEEFSYSVSHDLRAPLRAMSGYARILVEDHAESLDDEARHHLDRIQASSQEMGRQLDGLLTISRLQRQRLNPTGLDMALLFHQVWETVRPAGRTVDFAVGDLPEALADRDLVTQLLAALLENAVKFTSRTGEPRVEVTAETDGDGTVRYAVRDNGVGFDLRCAQRLFSPFQLLHPAHEYPGLGIGLAVAQQIVRRHGGTIDATAEPDRGARFSFTLPESRCVRR